jgi:hypothetical protein
MTINGANAARYDVDQMAAYCAAFEADARTGRVSDDELYVMFPRLAPTFQSSAQQPVACTVVDGYGVCFTAASYSRWQDGFDITRQALPRDDELRAFRDALEAEYRDRMRRPSTAMAGTIEGRLGAVAEYLAFRAKGCAHDEASSLVAAHMTAVPMPRLCRGHRLDAGPLPPPQETLAFRRSLDQLSAGAGVTVSDTSHVDVEGEAVWVHDYLVERFGGRDHGAATDAVVTKIRAIVAGAL